MTRRLLQRRQRLLAKLPPLEEVLRGSIVERSVRCGRKGCHCAQDGDGHHAVYLSVTVGRRRTEQISVPSTLLPAVRRGVATYHKWWEIMEEISAINRQLLRQQRDAQRAPPGRTTRRRRRG